MSDTTVPSSQIDVINEMLLVIGESPVSSLSGDVGVDVVSAKATLKSIQRIVQTEGWLFNTEHDFPLSRDIDGRIAVPTNALKVDVAKQAGVDAVLRGTYMYDRANHTDVFTANLTARIVFGLTFEEMPETARHYISYRACRKFQDTSVGAVDLHRYTKADEMRARVDFVGDQAEDAERNGRPADLQ